MENRAELVTLSWGYLSVCDSITQFPCPWGTKLLCLLCLCLRAQASGSPILQAGMGLQQTLSKH